jgi:hypothetical protein
MRLITLLLFALVFIMCSCHRIDQQPVLKGELESVVLENLKGIPAEYGNLVSITTHAAYEGWSQLWFVDDNNTIRMVRVQFHNNRINEDVLVIPRY